MKKTFQYNRDGEVRTYSDGNLKCSKLEQVELNITADQLVKIKSNLYNLFIRDKKLVLEEGEELVRKKEQEQKDKEIEQLINKAKEKYGDLIPLLEKIIKLRR